MALDIKISYSWTNYCRLCLLDKGLKIPIFESDGLAEEIPVKIKECLNISTYDGDPLPRMICHQCLCKLNTAYELRQKALESFRLLLSHLEPLKHVSSVHAYMKDADLCLNAKNDQSESNIKDTSVKGVHSKKPGTIDVAQPSDHRKDEEMVEEEVTVRTTRSKTAGRASLASSDPQQKGSITVVPDIEKPSVTSCVKTLTTASPSPISTENAEETPIHSKPFDKLPDDHSVENSDEEATKRKRRRITDHYDEALMDAGGNLVLAAGAGRTRDSRNRKRIGPASRTRALASCLSTPSPWQCVLCSCYFSSHNMLRRHLSNCLICQTCGGEFSSAKEKAQHEQIHLLVNLSRNVDLPYRCNLCSRAFAAHLMMKLHMKYDHKFTRPEKSMSEDDQLGGEYSQEGNHQDEDCDSCQCDSDSDEEGGSDEESKDEEDSSKAADSDGKEACPKCTRIFATKQRLMYHMLAHDSLIKCSWCPWMFPPGPGRRKHHRKAHGDKKELVAYTCSLCKETFESKSILYLHKKSHERKDDSSTKAVSSSKSELEHCHLCDKLIRPSRLMAHLYQHASAAYDKEGTFEKTQDRNVLQCSICNVTCQNKEVYKVHMAKHLMQKTFKCDGCNQGFANVEAVNRHSCPLKDGDGDGKLWNNCKHCGQVLLENANHVCDNECPICHKIFKSARGQRLHIQSKHEVADSSAGNNDEPPQKKTVAIKHEVLEEDEDIHDNFENSEGFPPVIKKAVARKSLTVKSSKGKVLSNTEDRPVVSNSSEKPADKSSEKCMNNSSDPNPEKSLDEFSDKLPKKTAEKAVDKPLDKPVDITDKPLGKPGDTADKPPNKSSENLSDKPLDKPSDNPSDKSSNKPQDTPPYKVSVNLDDQSQYKDPDKSCDTSLNNPVDESLNRPSNKPLDESLDKSLVKSPDKAPSKSPDVPVDKTPNPSSDSSSSLKRGTPKIRLRPPEALIADRVPPFITILDSERPARIPRAPDVPVTVFSKTPVGFKQLSTDSPADFNKTPFALDKRPPPLNKSCGPLLKNPFNISENFATPNLMSSPNSFPNASAANYADRSVPSVKSRFIVTKVNADSDIKPSPSQCITGAESANTSKTSRIVPASVFTTNKCTSITTLPSPLSDSNLAQPSLLINPKTYICENRQGQMLSGPNDGSGCISGPLIQAHNFIINSPLNPLPDPHSEGTMGYNRLFDTIPSAPPPAYDSVHHISSNESSKLKDILLRNFSGEEPR